MKKLPIGIQTFKEIILDNYLYVDKTGLAVDLVNDYKYVFLSRPRRFGKSMMVSTLQALFEGEKQLFEGLGAYNKWNWEEKFPVIKIEFGGNRSSEELIDDFKLLAQKHCKKYDIEIDESIAISKVLDQLIKKLHDKFNQKVIILIDEYDKPILDNIDQPEEAKKIREILKVFYTQIKQNDAYLRFVMLTGVSKFSKVSLFSGLNNLHDISLKPKYSSICGYTQAELEHYFENYLHNVNLSDVKDWYNGYNFLGDSVYNPFDILKFIDYDFQFRNYWFETGTPSFLLKLIKQNQYFVPNLTNIIADESLLNSFDIENIKLETLMFQTGYLTIEEEFEEFQEYFYKLKFPNLEVYRSFYNSILDLFSASDKTSTRRDVLRSLANANLDKLKDSIFRMFANIPHHNYTKNQIANYEGFYASVIFTYLSSLGLDVIAEDITNKGRIDLTLQFENKTYLFEFKVVDEDPLAQMKKMKYYEKYTGEIYLIGIKFNPKERNIEEFVWEQHS